MIKRWKTVASRPGADFRIFTLRTDIKISPRTGKQHDFCVIDCNNWVNVIAVTPDEHLVMVEQYRHGSDTVELEVPGGMMETGERSPVAAGLRELREETGFAGDRRTARVIGRIFPNPAIMSNVTSTVLVEDCVLKHEPEFDPGEDLKTRLVPFKEIPGLVAAGKIRHALVVVALYHYELWRRMNTGTGKSRRKQI